MKAISASRRYPALLLLALCLGLPLSPARQKKRHSRHTSQVVPVEPVDYTRDIKPILEARCCRCHGPTRCKAGLRLDSAAAIRQGGDSGTVIVPGDSAHSVLIAVLTGAEDRPQMPPSGKPLSARQVALLKDWIDRGARAPDAGGQEPAQAATRDHWAFRPPLSPPVPAVRNTGWARNPIDAFLAAEQEKKGVTPSPAIARELLLRRVSVDLIGLPPTREQLQEFLADPSEDAYEKAVDRLLASSQYGERWGRHWMDVWRYSDPDGRKAKRDIWWGNAHIWRWRDWIVQSLNADKGYDRMVVEMLAGDEVASADADSLAATGFLVRNWFKLDRNIWLNNTVEHTARGLLGLTINCARCHDHKFDPISQKEYYRFRAFFEPHDIRTDPLRVKDGEKAPVAHAYDINPKAPTWLFVRGDEKTPDKSIPITPGVPAVLRGPPLQIMPIEQLASTGRRLALGRWIGDRQNPLAARVVVNHVWARHFGRPLVENVADFGVRTPPPAQQPLLDWLAVEFMEHQWSMKWLHRLLLTSAAYRMHSSSRAAPPANLAADPDNHLYWRMNSRRMEAEVVRDSLLWLGGVLDLTATGPPLDQARGADSARRSLYYRYSREDRMEFLTVFDAPGTEECYRRQESIVPQQALALENSPFAWDQAGRIARRLDTGSSQAFVTAAFEHVLGRGPAPAEAEACQGFLARQERLLADPARLSAYPPSPPPAKEDPRVKQRVPGLPLVLGTARSLPPIVPAAEPRGRAREYLIHALLNHNDFITIR